MACALLIGSRSRRIAGRLGALRAGTYANVTISQPLTPRELDVLRELARSSTYEEVGERLSMSVNTVRTHVRAIYDKLDACSRTEAVLSAARLGWLELERPW
jgi:LuxR family transcriptional regulator, maltose regulon positive regulatory protein